MNMKKLQINIRCTGGGMLDIDFIVLDVVLVFQDVRGG
jgi:hypothetical protein